MPKHEEVRDDGYWWDDEFEEWNPPDYKFCYKINRELDGTLTCWFVYMGSWNVEVTAEEEFRVRPTMPEQEYYQWLLDNRSNYDDQGYEELNYGT